MYDEYSTSILQMSIVKSSTKKNLKNGRGEKPSSQFAMGGDDQSPITPPRTQVLEYEDEYGASARRASLLSGVSSRVLPVSPKALKPIPAPPGVPPIGTCIYLANVERSG